MKVGETLPIGDLSFDDSIKILTMKCNCNNSFILRVPDCHIEALPRYYDEFHYECMGCKWKSPIFRTRTL